MLAPQLVLVLGLAIYVGVARLVQSFWGLGPRPIGALPALVLVLVPAMLWLVHFYWLDRHEPEPPHFVLATFLLGALVAAPLASWLIHELFAIDQWLNPAQRLWQRLAISFLVIGTAQELCKYLVVRYTIYLSDEFDEPADGIIYSTAVGIGFATALSFRYVRSGVLLDVGAINVAMTTLAHACFAGAAGYALGQAKFTSRAGARQLKLALGLLVAVALNGVFFLLQDLVVRPGIELRPWRGLILSGGFAVLVFGVLSLLMQRSLQQGQAGGLAASPVPARAEGLRGILRHGDLRVVGVGVLLLCGGWLVRAQVIGRTELYRCEGLSLRVPATWIALSGRGPRRLELANVLAAEVFKPQVTAAAQRVPAALRPEELASYVELNLQERLQLFHLVSRRELKLGGQRAVRLDYAYALNPGARRDDPAATDVPVAVRASTLAVLARDRVLRVDVKQSVAQQLAAPELANEVLSSVHLEGKR